MRAKSDRFPGLSANRMCSLTGVRPQTRETWVRRGLLRSSDTYGELDVIEQAVVKQLLQTIPKGHVDHVWHELRPQLRSVLGDATAWVWDPEARLASQVATAEELRDAVVHGRPVHVIPVGHITREARRVYRVEVTTFERVADASRKPAAGRRPRRTGTE